MGLTSFARRLFLSQVQLEPEPDHDTSWLDEVDGRTPIARCGNRQVCTVAGSVDRVSVGVSRGKSFSATLRDDSGATLDLLWPGRETVVGVRVGVSLEATGLVSQAKHGGLLMTAPEYTLIAR